MNFFCPHHLKYQVNANSIITLYNSISHDMKQFFLPTHIAIKLLPPKFTSRHQPDDTGIIADLKVGCTKPCIFGSYWKFLSLLIVLKGWQYQGSYKEEDAGEYNMLASHTCCIVRWSLRNLGMEIMASMFQIKVPVVDGVRHTFYLWHWILT